jgi:hypothetical protein
MAHEGLAQTLLDEKRRDIHNDEEICDYRCRAMFAFTGSDRNNHRASSQDKRACAGSCMSIEGTNLLEGSSALSQMLQSRPGS